MFSCVFCTFGSLIFAAACGLALVAAKLVRVFYRRRNESRADKKR